MPLLNILAIAKDLVGLGTTLAKAHQERRIALADYLDKIASCIEGILHENLGDGRGSPKLMQLCTELEVYGTYSSGILDGLLPQKQHDEISDRIMEATSYRQDLADLFWSPEYFNEKGPAAIRELHECVGLIRGTANTLRAPASIRMRTSSDATPVKTPTTESPRISEEEDAKRVNEWQTSLAWRLRQMLRG